MASNTTFKTSTTDAITTPTRSTIHEDTDGDKVKEEMDFWDSLPEWYKVMVLEKEARATGTKQKVVSHTTTTTHTLPITTTPKVSHTIQPVTLFPPPTVTSRTPPGLAMPTESHLDISHHYRPYTTPSHYTPAPTFIMPEFSNYEIILGAPNESWENFIDRFEIHILTYQCNDQQKALNLPRTFREPAFTKYKDLIREKPNCTTNYILLKEEVRKIFTVHSRLQARNLNNIVQGKRTVGEYYVELAAACQSAYADVPEIHRNKFLLDKFTQGLRDPIRQVVDSKSN